MQTGERLGCLGKNEEKGLSCSLEGGDPESLKCGGGGLSGCVLRQVFGTGDMQPRPEEMPLFKWGKPLSPAVWPWGLKFDPQAPVKTPM